MAIISGNNIQDNTGITNITMVSTGIPSFPNGYASTGANGIGYAAGNNSGETIAGSTSTNFRSYDPSGNINVTLNNAWLAGREFVIHHLGVASSTALITLKANDASTIATIYPKMSYRVAAITSTPAASTDWIGLSTITSSWIQYASGTGVATSIISESGGNFNVGTTGNFKGLYKREGSDLLINTEFVINSTGANNGTGTYSLQIPSGLTILNTIFDTTNHNVGELQLTLNNNTNNSGFGTVLMSSGISLPTAQYQNTTAANAFSTFNATSAIAGVTGNFARWKFRVPITGWSQTKG